MSTPPGPVPGFLHREFVAVDHPAWRQAHASSVLIADGATLVAWFGGSREGTSDNRIFLARRDGTWSSPVVVAEGEVAHWNPVLATGPDQAIWLFFKRGNRISTWRTWVRRSADGGRTWSEATVLVPGVGGQGGRGPVKNPPLWVGTDTWLAPASTETWAQQQVRWDPFVDRSTDGGRTWTPVPIPVDRATLRGPGLIQPALIPRQWGVLALMRSTEAAVYRSESADQGRTWSSAVPTLLPNNNSGLAALCLPDGRIACVHNPVSGDWAPRCPLVVSVSEDDGATWRTAVVLEDGRTPVHPDLLPDLPPPEPFAAADDGVRTTGMGEYSYPAVVLNGDDLLVTYTWQRRGIVAAQMPLAEI